MIHDMHLSWWPHMNPSSSFRNNKDNTNYKQANKKADILTHWLLWICEFLKSTLNIRHAAEPCGGNLAASASDSSATPCVTNGTRSTKALRGTFQTPLRGDPGVIRGTQHCRAPHHSANGQYKQIKHFTPDICISYSSSFFDIFT